MFALYSSYIILAGQVILLLVVPCVVVAMGLYWYAMYLRILFYLNAYHSSDLLRLGVSVKKLLYAYLLSNGGFILWLLSIPFAPELFLPLFLVVFIIPMPLYIFAQRSVWNYWFGFWPNLGENFGDEKLKKMRENLKRSSREFLRVLVLTSALGVGVTLLGIILQYV